MTSVMRPQDRAVLNFAITVLDADERNTELKVVRGWRKVLVNLTVRQPIEGGYKSTRRTLRVFRWTGDDDMKAVERATRFADEAKAVIDSGYGERMTQ
jgi:hypothetical protein